MVDKRASDGSSRRKRPRGGRSRAAGASTAGENNTERHAREVCMRGDYVCIMFDVASGITVRVDRETLRLTEPAAVRSGGYVCGWYALTHVYNILLLWVHPGTPAGVVQNFLSSDHMDYT